MQRTRAVVAAVSWLALVGCGGDDAGSGSGAGASGAAGAGAAGASAGAAGSGGTASGGVGGSSGAGGSSGSASGGIASEYPGDQGIEADPRVIFADDFERYRQVDDLWTRWDNVFQVSETRLAREAENVHSGAQALEHRLPQRAPELSNAVQKVLAEEREALHLRWYAKLESNFDVVGSSHNGGGMSARYFVNGQATPGVPADGRNKFLVEYEHWRGEARDASPGLLNVYLYHPEQRSQWGDHFFPSGRVLPNSGHPFDFGADFQERPERSAELDRWHCYEMMVRANAPGARDGRITLWLDGEVVADFPNLRLRDVASLKIDRFQLSFHAGSNPNGATRKWYDDVVAASAYIGPRVP